MAVKKLLNRTTVTPDDQQELNLIRNNFPEFTQTILWRWQTGWALDDLNAVIEDYGNSEYRSRVRERLLRSDTMHLKSPLFQILTRQYEAS